MSASLNFARHLLLLTLRLAGPAWRGTATKAGESGAGKAGQLKAAIRSVRDPWRSHFPGGKGRTRCKVPRFYFTKHVIFTQEKVLYRRQIELWEVGGKLGRREDVLVPGRIGLRA